MVVQPSVSPWAPADPLHVILISSLATTQAAEAQELAEARACCWGPSQRDAAGESYPLEGSEARGRDAAKA